MHHVIKSGGPTGTCRNVVLRDRRAT